MKKNAILLVALLCLVAMSLSSCSEKKEVKKLGNYELLEQNGKFGLAFEGHTILAPTFDKIEAQNASVFATSGNSTTIVVNTSEVFTGEISEITPTANAEYSIIHTPDGVYLWKNDTGIIRGKFGELVFIATKNAGEFIFCRDGDNWGALRLNDVLLAPRKFNKVYIAISKEGKFAVLTKDSHNWQMYDEKGVTDGSPYNISSKQLEKRLKKFDTSAPYGIVNIDWKL